MPPVVIVNACLRGTRGGSPTAVLDDTGLGDDERRSVPILMGTSHAVFVSAGNGAGVALRFFTATGELPACGHGTVAALAFLAEHGRHDEYAVTLRTPARALTGRAVRVNGRFEASFDLGVVDVREPAAGEHDDVLAALGVTAGMLAPGMCVASPGRPRLLVPVATRSVLAALAPDAGRLRAACDDLGLLGCYVYCGPAGEGRVAARMFAPSIGVPEDIANANGTACLAARLARGGTTGITVDMGDALGTPATITAVVRRSATGPLVRVGGAATIARVVPSHAGRA